MPIYVLIDDAELSDEQKDIVQAARKFAKEEILPVAAQLDRTGEVTQRSILLQTVVLERPLYGLKRAEHIQCVAQCGFL